jgi:hypothetical protein
MNLDEAQRKKVIQWIGEGQKLSEIQNRLASELGLRLTYMEVRLLVDDLKLMPKDAELPQTPAEPSGAVLSAGHTPGAPAGRAPSAPAPAEPTPAPRGGVSVTVDQLTRPGAVVSGKVTFSDGNRADWYLDQTGRLGLSSATPGYRPSASDVQQFQMALESELSKLGF